MTRVTGFVRRLILIALLAGALSGGPAAALDGDLSLQQFIHTRWTAAEGAPPIITALAQGEDGFLWVGSATGLHRFDGVTFEHIPSLEADAEGRRVTALLAARDGEIWVGYDSGHVAIYRDSALRDITPAASADSYVIKLVQTSDGAVWAALGRPDNALLRHVDGRWEEVAAALGLPELWIVDLLAARDGSLWVTSGEWIVVLPPGAMCFEHVATPDNRAALAQDASGAVWVSDDRGSRMLVAGERGSPSSLAFPTPGSQRSFRTIFDRDGNLWGAHGAGVFRIRAPAAVLSLSQRAPAERVERLTAKDGQTFDGATRILEDREGAIWVGTSLGLHRFRAASVVVEPSIANVPTFGFRVFGASDGSVYAGTADAIHRVRPGGRPEILLQGLSQADAICEGPDGAVWILTRDRLVRVLGKEVTMHPAPESSRAGLEGCVVDHRNVLWANGQRAGLFSRASEEWEEHAPEEPETWALVLTTDGARRPLLFLRSGDLVRADSEGRPRDVLHQMSRSGLSTVFQGRAGLYVGGTYGLVRLHNGDADLLSSQQHPWLGEPSGVVETPDDQTWLITNAGIVGLQTAALERAFTEPDTRLEPTILDFADGLPNIHNRGGVRDAAWGGDGRVWFATTGGVVWVDPARLVRNPLPPPVVIRAVEANGVRHRDPARLTLEPGASSIAVHYTALSLSIPERVQFRYRLEGVDDRWVDAGNRRDAHYTNLGPGAYRFRVIAANDDGIWNEAGAYVDFTIPSTFLQSIWFKFIVAFVFVGLFWLAYTLRLRQETARLQRRFDVRIAERERIARELHDTLLQGFHGLMLRFQSVANRVPAESGVRATLDEALDRADAVLVEGRARVRDLRATTAQGDFAQAIVDTAQGIIDGDSPRFALVVEGNPRALHALVSEEVLRIAEEAIRNAVRHASAKSINAVLAYGAAELRVTFRDDGVGISAPALTHGEKAGHFGLIGMRERAERIGGRLAVTSREWSGVEIALSAPALVAYKDRRIGLFVRLGLVRRGGPE